MQRLRSAMRKLKQAGVPDASDSIRILLKHYRDNPQTFDAALKRRIAREPLQYIIGEWDFHELRSILVRKPMLIPRAETEEFVEFILHNTTTTTPKRVLDIGAGTGAIGLALANAWQRGNTTTSVFAIDVLQDACDLANENGLRLGFSKSQYECISRATSLKDYVPSEAFDLVVSNPPYIPSHEISTLQQEVSGHESILALDGGIDGGDIAREIFARMPVLLKPGGDLFLELHHTHTDHVIKQWLEPYGNVLEYRQVAKDFQGYPRFHWISKR